MSRTSNKRFLMTRVLMDTEWHNPQTRWMPQLFSLFSFERPGDPQAHHMPMGRWVLQGRCLPNSPDLKSSRTLPSVLLLRHNLPPGRSLGLRIGTKFIPKLLALTPLAFTSSFSSISWFFFISTPLTAQLILTRLFSLFYIRCYQRIYWHYIMC